MKRVGMKRFHELKLSSVAVLALLTTPLPAADFEGAKRVDFFGYRDCVRLENAFETGVRVSRVLEPARVIGSVRGHPRVAEQLLSVVFHSEP